jgi:hypothetical protein
MTLVCLHALSAWRPSFVCMHFLLRLPSIMKVMSLRNLLLGGPVLIFLLLRGRTCVILTFGE